MTVGMCVNVADILFVLTTSIADNYSPVCTVVADTSSIPKSEMTQQSATEMQCYRKEFDIIVLFGMTELKAQWTENVVPLRLL